MAPGIREPARFAPRRPGARRPRLRGRRAATFYLAPGVVLHHRPVQGQYGPRREFTLLSSDGEPVTVTSIDQIRHEFAVRAAELAVRAAGAKDEALHTA
ncbi:hypothetical protein [Streptomyces sp. NBC_00872]|uniref:hypothetical protein n=1 Tax=Streptomyces sp. NBC_00872 TaxID=2903686 RepID=UPI002F907FE0|nr:hypothetical protein OG214_38085 [Streptomyces sp. NBC_00872]